MDLLLFLTAIWTYFKIEILILVGIILFFIILIKSKKNSLIRKIFGWLFLPLIFIGIPLLFLWSMKMHLDILTYIIGGIMIIITIGTVIMIYPDSPKLTGLAKTNKILEEIKVGIMKK